MRLGPLSLQPPRRLEAGRAKVAVRPEAWRINAAGGSGLAGTVTRCTYLGSLLEVTLDTELGSIFVVVPDVESQWAEGDRATLTLAARGLSFVSA